MKCFLNPLLAKQFFHLLKSQNLFDQLNTNRPIEKEKIVSQKKREGERVRVREREREREGEREIEREREKESYQPEINYSTVRHSAGR